MKGSLHGCSITEEMNLWPTSHLKRCYWDKSISTRVGFPPLLVVLDSPGDCKIAHFIVEHVWNFVRFLRKKVLKRWQQQQVVLSFSFMSSPLKLPDPGLMENALLGTADAPAEERPFPKPPTFSNNFPDLRLLKSGQKLKLIFSHGYARFNRRTFHIFLSTKI